MENKELIELAAKAMGFTLTPMQINNVSEQGDDRFIGYLVEETGFWFNPLTSDADCFRMETELEIDIEWLPSEVEAAYESKGNPTIIIGEPYTTDKAAARRLASTRVAAEIGRRL